MVSHKTVASRVGLIGTLNSLLILGMVSVTFNDVVVNICMDSKQPISMASVNDSVNVNHGRILEDDINTT